MKKYTVEELTSIFERNDYIPCYYTEEDRQRVLNNPTAQPYLEQVKKMYGEYTANMTVALPFKSFKRFYKDGNRQEGEYWYYYNRRKLATVAIMAWVYQEQEYYDELENILWAIMDEYVWNIPAHVGPTALTELQQDDFNVDLFSAETCMMISEIISMVGDKLEPIVSKRAERMINERLLDLYESGKRFWWMGSHINWAAVCGGESGVTAIYMKKDPAALAKIIHSCLNTMECYLSGFPDDGACTEGLGYWGYGFGHFTYFGDILYKRTRGEINIFDDEKVKRIAEFPKKCFFKGGKVVTFSDCGGSDRSKFSLSITRILGQFYPDITLPERELVGFDYGSGTSFEIAIRELIWIPESFDGYKLVPGTYLLPEAQWYMSSSAGGMGLAAKAGYNWEGKEAHNHNDVGNFHIYKNDANLISDIGAGVYKGNYFNHQYRYENFACSSRGHNLPIIDDDDQKYGERFRASGTVMSEDGGITSDIAGAYDIENLESLIRNVRLDKENECVYLTDTYKFKEAPKSVTERFVSYHEPKIENGEVTISANGETLTFTYDKNMLKPVLRVYEDVGNMVRHRDGFKAYMVDFELINPTAEFTLEFTMK